MSAGRVGWVDVDREEDVDVDKAVDKAVDEAVDEVVDVDVDKRPGSAPIENKLKTYPFVNIWLWSLRTPVSTLKLLGWKAKKTCSLHLS